MIEPKYVQTDIHGNELTDEQKKELHHRDNRLRLEPFHNINWKTAESRDKWRDLLSGAAYAKMEAEWRSVLSDKSDRTAAIIHIDNQNREDWMEKISKHDLFFKPIKHAEPFNGHSHSHTSTSPNDPHRITYSVISTDEEAVEAVAEAEGPDNRDPASHAITGKYLGFPECCRTNFRETFVDDSRVDPMYEVSCNTESAEAIGGDREQVLVNDPSPWANVLYRYFGWSFITHIPCSWDCEKSIEVGETRGEIMADLGYEDEANALWQWLQLPMEWTAKNGIVHVKNKHAIMAANTSSYWSEKRVVWGEMHEDGGDILGTET